MNVNDDSDLYTGADAPSTFGNDEATAETRKELEEEQRATDKAIQVAESEIKSLNAEIANANVFTDFIDSLGVLPTDIPNADLRAKVEARQMYLAYLMGRKNRLIADMEEAGYEVATELTEVRPTMPTPACTDDVTPSGWQLIRQGLGELFRRRHER